MFISFICITQYPTYFPIEDYKVMKFCIVDISFNEWVIEIEAD